MTVKIRVRDAFLAALMLTRNIEVAEDDEESECSAAAAETLICGVGELWLLGSHRVVTQRMRKPSQGSYAVRSPTLFSVAKR